MTWRAWNGSAWLISLCVLGLVQPLLAQTDAVGGEALIIAEPMPVPSADEKPVLSLRESLSGQALVDYEAARILVRDGDYQGALVKFQHAFEQAGDVRLLWNLAVCEKNLRHYTRVLPLLERYEREGERYISLSHRQEVDAVLQTVRTLVSTVELSVQPGPAQVFVDDVPAGEIPGSEPLLVDLGVRRIRIFRPGYKDYVITHNFAGASTATFDVTLTLEVHEGKLTVSAGSDDAIRVDGQLLGRGHWEGTLPSGEHSVRVDASGMRPYVNDLVIEDEQQRMLHVTLEAEKSSISPLIWVATSVLLAGGLATGGYFLFRSTGSPSYRAGTWDTQLLQ